MEEEVKPLSDNPVREPFNMNDPYGEMRKALDTLRGVVDTRPFFSPLAEDTSREALGDARLALLSFEQFMTRVRHLVDEAKVVANEKYGMGGGFVYPVLRGMINPVEEMLPQDTSLESFPEILRRKREEIEAANRACDKGS